MIVRNVLLPCLAVLALVGCQTPSTTPVDLSADPDEPALVSHFPREVSVQEAQDAVVRSLRNREWNITSTSDDGAEARLFHRRYDSRIRVEVSPNEMKIYSDSWLVDRNGERVRREHPEGWLRNIERDVRRSLGFSR